MAAPAPAGPPPAPDAQEDPRKEEDASELEYHPYNPSLGSLEPDTFALVCTHLRHREVAALAGASWVLRQAVASNDRLWSGLYARQFPQPWLRHTRVQAAGRSSSGGGGSGGPASSGVQGSWRRLFLATHTACQQLRSADPQCREWTTDATPVHFASIHGSGPRRLTLAAQGSTVEVRCAAPATKSFQFYGHTARVSCAAVLRAGGSAGGGGGGVQRLGLVTGSHDQTVRLWAANADPDSYEFRAQSLQLLTPLRTLRGHQESVTSLQLVSSGSTGVTIAATGGKDRVVRLWGLAPLVPSPVQKPQIATLRGHGAPVTCLAATCGSSDGCHSSWDWDGGGGGGGYDGSPPAGGSGAGSGWLLSGSLDARIKSWDPWTAACTGTAKCAAAVSCIAPATAAPLLQPHTLFAAGGGGVQLVDLRSMRGVGGVAVPPPAELYCFAQWGWDLALGGSDGARVYDLRMLSSSCSCSAPSSAGSSSTGGGGASSSSGGGGRGASSAVDPSSGGSSSSSWAAAGRGLPERLRLAAGHTRPVTSIHVDRHKIVTATDRYGEAPLRVWSATSGDCLAELGSCQPPAQPPPQQQPPAQPTQQAQQPEGGAAQGGRLGDGGDGGGDGGGEALAHGGDEAAGQQPEQQEGEPAGEGPHRRQYQRQWEGVTALACRGALLVSGSSGGTVCERDYSHGGLPGGGGLEGGGAAAAAAGLAGKFWQY